MAELLIQDDSHRLVTYGAFMVFVVALVPIWWYTMMIARASLSDLGSLANVGAEDGSSWSRGLQLNLYVLRRAEENPETEPSISLAWREALAELEPSWELASGSAMLAHVNLKEIIIAGEDPMAFNDLVGLQMFLNGKVSPALGDDGPNLQIFLTHHELVPAEYFADLASRRVVLQDSDSGIFAIFDYSTTQEHSLQSLIGSLVQKVVVEASNGVADFPLQGAAATPSSGANLVSIGPGYQVCVSLVFAEGLLAGLGSDAVDLAALASSNLARSVESELFPVLEELDKIADLRVHTQIRTSVPLTHLNSAAPPLHQAGVYNLGTELLINFVDENRWNLAGPTLSDFSPIQFVIFIPPPEWLPLRTGLAESPLAFAYEQWGAVYLLQPSEKSDFLYLFDRTVGDVKAMLRHILNADHLRPALQVFAAQLKDMFGASSGAASPSTSSDHGQVAVWGKTSRQALPGLFRHPFTRFEWQTLLNRRVHSLVQRTLGTLASLERLVKGNEQIAVPEEVRRLVIRCRDCLMQTKLALRAGKLERAQRSGLEALQYGEAAFFHPSMMAHQYFPEDHKIGVYVPLLFPFVLPPAVATLVLLWEYLAVHRGLWRG